MRSDWQKAAITCVRMTRGMVSSSHLVRHFEIVVVVISIAVGLKKMLNIMSMCQIYVIFSMLRMFSLLIIVTV